MVNLRLRKLADRLGNKELPKMETPKPEPQPEPVQEFSTPESSFILSYDDFGKELIRKANERFRGTAAEIPLEGSGEVENMYALKRLALITTIYQDKQLQSTNLWPITPLQSEQLLREGKLPKPDKYWEDLALILYDRSSKGSNTKEAESLYESLRNHQLNFKLSNSDLESKLLVVNAGLVRDTRMPHGVKPVALQGLTKAYPLPVLEKTGEDFNFEFGLKGGLPSVDELGKGNRTLYMPSASKDIGLRVLYRYRDLDLVARNVVLSFSDSVGRVNFARRA